MLIKVKTCLLTRHGYQMVPADRHTFDLKQIGSTYSLVLTAVVLLGRWRVAFSSLGMSETR